MQLDRIEISGFKSIKSASLELRPLNVMIGANGSGKSNVLGLFEMLAAIGKGELQRFVARAGGAATLLHHGPKHTSTAEIAVEFAGGRFAVSLVHAPGDTLLVENEALAMSRSATVYSDITPQQSKHESVWARLHLSRPPGKEDAGSFFAAIREARVYRFHDTSATARIKQSGKIDDNAFLRPDGSNLAAFLFRLQTQDNTSYRRIVAAIRQAAPFFDDFTLRANPLNGGTMQLEWREVNSDAYFNAHALSDGTLRFMCLATLLLQPELPSLVLIDEPELGLHPYAISQLAALLRSASKRAQVLVATQSVTLVNQFNPEDLVVVEREDAATVFKRPQADELATWLDGYSLGELWEKNVLGGRPQHP